MSSTNPVNIEPTELATWSERRPLAFRLAMFWARCMPRGKDWVPRYLGRRLAKHMKLVIRTRADVKLAVDPQNLDLYTSICRADAARQSQVLEGCCRLLQPGMVFYDVGASAGLLSLSVAKTLGDQIEVHAFEPQRGLARNLALSARLNDLRKLFVHKTLLGNREGAADLFVPEQSLRASMVPRSTKTTRIRCPMATIDALVEQKTISKPDVLRVDVEGAEFDVFRGAAHVIRHFRPQILFVCDLNAERFGHTPEQLCRYLRGLGGYEFQPVTAEGLVVSGSS